MRLRHCCHVLKVLLLLAANVTFIASADDPPAPAAAGPDPESSCTDESTMAVPISDATDGDVSTGEPAPCTATDPMEMGRSDGKWWLFEGDLRPAFCQRLWPEKSGGRPEGEGSPPAGRWPWMVMLGRQKVSGQPQFGVPPADGTDTDLLGSVFCGGVLVGWGFVLTAAHCLTGDLSINEAGAVAVLLGDRATGLPDGTYDGAVRRISHVLPHPTADLALALLDTVYQGLPRWVRPVCLPPIAAPVPAGSDVEVAGWSPEEADGPRLLREAALRVSDPAECEAAYSHTPLFKRSFPGGVNGTALCAAPRGDGGPVPLEAAWCSAQGGWPLLARRQDGRYEVVGISASGVGCRDPGLPSVFTRVSAYMSWINGSLTPGPYPGVGTGPDGSGRTGKDQPTDQGDYSGNSPHREHPEEHDHPENDIEFEHQQGHEEGHKRDPGREYDLESELEQALNLDEVWIASKHENVIEGEIDIEPETKPVYEPVFDKPVHEPDQKPEHKPVHEPEHEPEHDPDHEPVHEPDHEPVHEPDHEHVHEPEYGPNHEPEHKPDHEPDQKPEHKPVHEPDHDPEHKPDHEPDYEPEHEPVHEPYHEPDHEPVHEPEHELEHEPDHEPVHEPDHKPVHEPVNEPEPEIEPEPEAV